MKRIMVLFAVGACALTLVHAQKAKSSGKPYGSRDPEGCASTKEPVKGAPSSALATRYLRCHIEGIGPGNNMYLIENVKVEVGKGTPFLELSRGQRPFGADPDSLVYPIRGSYTSYQCSIPNSINNNFGKNCNTYENPNASGQCFRTGFGDWTCDMSDTDINNPNNRMNVAPPR